ncbi:hypothetical protein D1646_20185 [Pseudoflavonifractor sp. 60]|uniref:DUF6809 family protein n=1 Tax=Pseudoflavonifractor sp. 60 TaxID=2304576 RepID=UPI00136952DE|nr:DUF6809 family protein [Pseudoflavonifractor sp. 60]NBI69057.1 hypothetical protein [Pseudoflavonifractor sp. 60]
MNFYETKMGHIFFEHQVPQLINALNTLAASVTKPAPAAALPVSVDPKFLRDLFFGDYEPEIYKVSPELQRFNQTVDQAHKSLILTLSEDSIKQLEEYETALSERNIAVTEQAYKAGVHAAVQMIMAGLSYPTVEEQTEAGHDC